MKKSIKDEEVPVSKERHNREKRRVAFHEAGHAVISWYLPHRPPFLESSMADEAAKAEDMAGYSKYIGLLPGESTRQALLADITCNFGGFAAEELFYGAHSKNAHSDISDATYEATRLVTEFGMSTALGVRTIDLEMCSEYMKRRVEKEVDKILHTCLIRARKLAKKHRKQIKKVAEELYTRGRVTVKTITQLLGPPHPKQPGA